MTLAQRNKVKGFVIIPRNKVKLLTSRSTSPNQPHWVDAVRSVAAQTVSLAY